MLLSEIIRSFPSVEVTIVDERRFNYLSLLVPLEGIRTLSFLDDPKYILNIPQNVEMLLVTPEVVPLLQEKTFGLGIVEDPRHLFFQLHNYLSEQDGYRRPAFPTRIDPSATVSPLALVDEANVVVGPGVVIEPFVIVYPNTTIGENSIIRAGATIGGSGYEFKHSYKEIMSVTHTGGTMISNRVEIQNNTCIDRAIYPWDNTVISDDCKIDNLVHVAHGCKIGKRTMIVSNVGLGGRVVIGNDVWIGFGSTIRNGITIGNRARVNMGAVVTRSVGDDESVTGNFAIPHHQFLKLLKKDLQSLKDENTE